MVDGAANLSVMAKSIFCFLVTKQRCVYFEIDVQFECFQVNQQELLKARLTENVHLRGLTKTVKVSEK